MAYAEDVEGKKLYTPAPVLKPKWKLATTGAPPAVAPQFKEDNPYIGKAIEMGAGLMMQQGKNKNIPEYVGIDEKTSKLIMRKPSGWETWGLPPLMDNMIWEDDLQQHHDIFDWNALLDEETAAAEALALAEADAAKAAESGEVFNRLNPPKDATSMQPSDLDNMSLSELLELKGQVGSVKDQVFMGGGEDNVMMGPIPKLWDDITDRFGLQYKRFYQNFDFTPETFMSEIDRKIENIEDAGEVWRASPGAVDYFAANPDQWALITTNGDFDNKKFIPWFESMKGKLSLGDPNSVGVMFRNWVSSSPLFDYDTSYFID